MNAEQFVEQFLDLRESLRCPLKLLRSRCETVGLTNREVLGEIRSQYGNSYWVEDGRALMPGGSRLRGYKGFAFKDRQLVLPPKIASIWSLLPYRGPLSEFPLNPHQLAGTARSPYIARVREKDQIWVVRNIDPDYEQVAKLAKRLRGQRQVRQARRDREEAFDDQRERPLPPLTSRIWDFLPYKGKIDDFPIKVTVNQLGAACKGSADKPGRLAMIRRKDVIWIVRDIDSAYLDVRSLGKARRTWDGKFSRGREERDWLWAEFLAVFPHPDKSIN